VFQSRGQARTRSFPSDRGHPQAMNRPRISVCIPTYEPDPTFLAELLSSIAEQRYPRLQVVVSDDASSADVASMLRCADQLDIRFRRNEVNVGMVGNWNLAVEASEGTLVMVVHQDDVLEPGLLDAYVSEFEQDSTVVLCSCAEVFIDAHGNPADHREKVNGRSRIYRQLRRYVLDHDEMVRLNLRNGQAFGEPSAVMFRRETFDAVGGYDPAFEHAADVDFNLRAVGLGKAVYLANAFLRRRWHSDNLTWSHVADGASSRDRVRMFQRHAPQAEISPRELARVRVALVSHAVYDAARAVRRRRYDVAKENVSAVVSYARNPWRLYLERLREIVSGVNIDER